MNNTSITSELDGTAAAPALAPEAPKQPPVKKRGYIRRSLHQLRIGAWPTLKYMAETEVHTYAFSVAACTILSFVPAVVLLGSISRYTFHSMPMYNLLLDLVKEYLPVWNAQDSASVIGGLRGLVKTHRSIEIMSVIMLAISSTGVFEPLEVALNRVWGFKANRNYLMNQVVSLGLALACGVLALLSVSVIGHTQKAATRKLKETHAVSRLANRVDAAKRNNLENRIDTTNRADIATPSQPVEPQQPQTLKQTARFKAIGIAERILDEANKLVRLIILKFFALATSIVLFFLIFWLLPNGKVSPWDVLPAAVVTGFLLEIAKYAFMLVLAMKFLDFREDYGLMFYMPVTLIFWAFTAGLLLLGGAYLSAYGKTQGAEKE